jgi:hypothetical protein
MSVYPAVRWVNADSGMSVSNHHDGIAISSE